MDVLNPSKAVFLNICPLLFHFSLRLSQALKNCIQSPEKPQTSWRPQNSLDATKAQLQTYSSEVQVPQKNGARGPVTPLQLLYWQLAFNMHKNG